MGLVAKKIKQKFQDKLWWKGFVKKTGAVTITAAIGVTSLFGFVGCANQKIENVSVKNENIYNNNDTEELQSVVDSLKDIVSQINTDNNFENVLTEIDNKLAEIEAGTASKDDIIDDIYGLIAEIKDELKSIDERLDKLEQKEEQSETKEDNSTGENPAEKEEQPEENQKPNENDGETGGLKNQLTKLEAKLAVEDAFNNNHMEIRYGKVEIQLSPDGDVVGKNGQTDDYTYFNSDDGFACISDNGEERFGYINDSEMMETFDYKGYCSQIIDDENYVLDQEQSSENKFVFKREDGETLIFNFNNESFVEVGEDCVLISKSTQEKFEELLKECKSTLKTFGLLGDYTKAVNESLQFEYGEVSATNEENGFVNYGTAVFNGSECASQASFGSETGYLVYKTDDVYQCSLDEHGNKISEAYAAEFNGDYAETLKEELIPADEGFYYAISFDEGNGAYIINSYRDEGEHVVKIEVKFNEDLSIDCKITYGEILSTYSIKEISQERYNEVFSRISDICEEAKQQAAGLSQ